MVPQFRRLLLIVSPALLATMAASQEKSAERVTDLYGDTLPAGAVTRMGTTRLRPVGRSRCLAFSPDSKLVAVGSERTIHLWEVATGKQVSMIDGLADTVCAVVFSPDGRTLAAADKAVRLWDLSTGKELRRWQLPAQIYCLAFSPAGDSLAAGGSERIIHLLDVTTDKKRTVGGKHSGNVGCLAFSPDGKSLASGCWEGPTCVWDVATGKQLRRFDQPAKYVCWLSFATDSRTLAAGGDLETFFIWNVASGELVQQIKTESTQCAAAISADQRLLAVNSGGTSLSIWDRVTGQKLRELTKVPALGNFVYGGDFVTFSPNGAVLALRSSYGPVLLWDTTTGQPLYPVDAPSSAVETLAASPDGKTLASRHVSDPLIRLWDTTTGRLRHSFEGSKMAFSPDGNALIYIGKDGALMRRELTSGRATRFAAGQKDQWLDVAFAPDGQTLATGSRDGCLAVWDATTGRRLRQIQVQPVVVDSDGEQSTDCVTPLLFTADGQALAFAGRSYPKLAVCDASTGRVFRQFSCSAPWHGYQLALSPDSKTLASTGHINDHAVYLWELASGKQRMRIEGKSGWFQSVDYAADGCTLVTGGEDGVIRLWDPTTGKEIGQLAGHRASVTAVAFLPDGQLASGSGDSTLLVWQGPFSKRNAGARRTELTALEQDALWNALAGADAESAYQCLWTLVHAPASAIVLLHQRLRPVEPADPQRVAQLILNLDSEQFAARQVATEELEKIGELARAALRKALEGNPPLEVRQRVESLLERLSTRVMTPQMLQTWRAIEVLEHIGNADAQQLLHRLAQGAPGAFVTEEARQACVRLSRRR